MEQAGGVQMKGQSSKPHQVGMLAGTGLIIMDSQAGQVDTGAVTATLAESDWVVYGGPQQNSPPHNYITGPWVSTTPMWKDGTLQKMLAFQCAV